MVRSASGPKIMAADAAHFYEQVENEWPARHIATLGIHAVTSAAPILAELARDVLPVEDD